MNNQKVTLINLIGQVYQLNLVDNKLNIDHLPKGFYIINFITNDQETQSLKLVKH
jgi:hypothetical protein